MSLDVSKREAMGRTPGCWRLVDQGRSLFLQSAQQRCEALRGTSKPHEHERQRDRNEHQEDAETDPERIDRLESSQRHRADSSGARCPVLSRPR